MAFHATENDSLDSGTPSKIPRQDRDHNSILDETDVTVESLLVVLNGVAVATKACEELVKPLKTWISQQGARMAEACGVLNTSTVYLSAGGWDAGIASSLESYENGTKQLAKITLAVAILRYKSRLDINTTSVELDAVWSLIRDALIGPKSLGIQYSAARSAQGFLAIPLCSLVHDGCIDELFRLHVWLPDGERGVSEAAIHSHQPFAQSWILAGSGTNYSYNIETTEDQDLATHAEYALTWTAGKQTGASYKTHQTSSTVTNTGKLMRVTLADVEMHTCDMSYSIPAGSYHQSVVPAGRLHATLFFFDSQRGFLKSAGIAGPKEGQNYTQLRDPAGVTPFALAQIVDAARSWELSNTIETKNSDRYTAEAGLFKTFKGCALLQAECRGDAMKLFHSTEGSHPVQAICEDHSKGHRLYVTKLLGLKADLVDDQGFRALEDAAVNGDIVTEAIFLNNIQQQIDNKVKNKH